MSSSAYLIFHKDHPLHVQGVNSGAETATLQLARFLARSGHKVVVCANLPEGETTLDGVEFWNLGPDFETSVAFERADALGSYHLISAGRALPIMESRSRKACLSRTFFCHDPSGQAAGVNNQTLSRICDGIVCVSEAQRNLLVSAGTDPQKTHVIHNGVDLDLFKEGNLANRNLKKLVFVGALVPHKGAHLAIEAYAALKRTYPDLSLDIYGSSKLWGEAPYLNEAALMQQLPGLKFHDAQKQNVIATALQGAGIALCPSVWFEALGLASIEAQATGCPVIASDVGGLKETMRAGETGILLKDISAEALAKTIEELLQNPSKHQKMCQAAARFARQAFNWEKCAAEVCALCEGYKSIKNRSSGLISKKVGFMTTWNQQCGLATYCKYLLSEFEPDTYVVFAEKTTEALTEQDESFVERVWQRNSPDLSQLEAAIKKHDIGLLHLNFHDHQFYPHASLLQLIERLHTQGIKVVSHLHTTYTLDPRMKAFGAVLDGVFVHAPENKLQVVAHGVAPEKIFVLPHGVQQRQKPSPEVCAQIRSKLGISASEKIICSLGFVQPNKGVEAVIEAVMHLNARGVEARGFILGKLNEKLPIAQEYYKELKFLTQKAGIESKITFANRFFSETEISEYLAVADLVMMNYQSQYYEASGACSIALGSGALVATSLAPQFAPFGDAVWHMTAGFPAGVSAEVLLGADSTLRETVLKNAAKYRQDNSWPEIAKKLHRFYHTFSFMPGKSAPVPAEVVTKPASLSQSSPLRVLFQNRSNALTQRGGDTIVMERTLEGLKKHGVEVVIDLENREDPAKFSLVHLFNFALPDMTRAFAERAHAAGVPFVVTTLCEDVPIFHHQSHVLAASLVEYRLRGQDKQWWNDSRPSLSAIPACAHFDNAWTAKHATALITNGATESAVLKKYYPGIKEICEVKLGCDVGVAGDPTLFEKEYGVRDFVLSVGRLESRKNQLMLLKALEDSDLTVVLAAGGFSYQPDYEKAVREFKRKGKTIILGRVSREMLASAYAAAKVHALPSWYELPGLVSLEAARYGCSVVATRNGTAPDYFGELAYYCDPASESSIYQAVMAAYQAPRSGKISEFAAQYTWQRTADETYAVYQRVTNRMGKDPQENSMSINLEQKPSGTPLSNPISAQSGGYDLASQAIEFQEQLERGEMAIKNGEFKKAEALLLQAEGLNPHSVRLLRVQGACFLAQGEHTRGQPYFERALKLEPQDIKSLSGLGMCEIMQAQHERAMGRFIAVLNREPGNLIAIGQLMECAYATGKFTELEPALRRYVALNADDIQMQFCLSGCLLKTGNLADAQAWLDKVVKSDPAYKGITEMQQAITREKQAVAPKEVVAPKVAAPTPQTPRETIIVSVPEENPVDFMRRADWSSFSDTDVETTLSQLEENKRQKNIAKVKEGTTALLAKGNLTAEQQERAELLRAESAVMENDVETAAEIYNRVLTKNPRSARGLCGRGALSAHAGNWDGARSAFELSLSIKAEYDVALAGLGLCAYVAGKHEDAWNYYSRASRINCENVRALFGLIELGYPMNRLPEVQRALEAYLDLHAADIEFLYALAGCHYAQGHRQASLAALDKIAIFNPDHARAAELRDIISGKVNAQSLSATSPK